jgi:transcriptional regulator with XRE-family HTH domain
MKIGEKLRKIRDFYGYTQEDVASQIAVSTSQYCKYERDETPVTLETLEKISAVYKLTQVDILNWDEKNAFNFIGPNTGNWIAQQQTFTDTETSKSLLFKQMQEEITYLKAENKKLWDLIEKLKGISSS